MSELMNYAMNKAMKKAMKKAFNESIKWIMNELIHGSLRPT